ncbi:TetR/AcrR family transcriptional regulator [Duganella sp. HH101]|uniref:TetR/AcrR family transcriptional regulator n=1 Tax=Duganella sp. HH101 TaxID=1781066 RepID=UPI0008736969|nr:TetR family transcriptional regulator C-terminal domain-containing protein [Duganella sp. HH101]OFA02913.1 putative HTH-type transcriptional regulator YxaF [Duganella sp. HH101]OFA02962.1 putative HTH-type transcriptional regulator YxaF [Duganella sp. HH101]
MTTPPTRDRLIRAMGDALQRKGLHGVGLSEILAAADTPKGGLYHHFPGGKTELAVAAIEQQVAELCALLDKLLPAASDPVAALEQWTARAQQLLAASGFQRGCPLATVALESEVDDVAIRKALADGFAAIRERLALALQASGKIANAAGLAALIVAAYEGALLQARVAGSVAPMELVSATLFPLLRTQLQGNTHD